MFGMTFTQKLKMLCEAKGWNQADVMRAVGKVSPTTVSHWFAGIRLPDMERGLKLAKALGTTLDYLADDELDNPPAPEISDDDRMILRIARGMSADEAIRRLSAVPGVFQGVTSPRPPAPGSGTKKN